MRTKSVSHEQAVVDRIRRNPNFAIEYIQAALEESDEPAVLLIALRHVAQANGGMAAVAKRAGITRESLYRALSTKGNPTVASLQAIAKALGMTVTLKAA